MNQGRANLRGGPLKEADYAKLAKSWITPEFADRAMLRRVSDAEGAQILGRRDSASYSGIAFPYFLPGEDYVREYFIRRDQPDIEFNVEGKPKEKCKYLGPPGRGNMLYFMPGTNPELLDNLNVPVVITEGAKKTIALHRLSFHGLEGNSETPRFLPVGLSGVWSYKGTIGKTSGPDGGRRDEKGLISDLRRLPLQGRLVYIVFDRNVRTNTSVAAARRELTRELASLGAQIRWVDLPASKEDPGINGVDDLLEAWGPERVLELFAKAAAPDADRSSQAETILRLTTGLPLFHTPDYEGFARVPVGSRKEVMLIQSSDFLRWLKGLAYRELGKPPSDKALQHAIGVLETQAVFDALEASLFVRIAELNDRTYIDLCNAAGEVVEVCATGWSVITDAPVHFRRAKSLKSLPKPVLGGSIAEFRKFVNVGDDSNWLMLLCWIVAAYRARGPYPILILQGEQGSAKSTMSRMVRMLIDPSRAPVRKPPRDERDLLIAANNSWLISCDNLSHLPQWLSDALCRLSTGGGFSTRALYTDADEFFVDATRPVILNGIDHLARRPDLAERALILELPPISTDDRREEAQLYVDFEAELPKIFGALLTALSGALARMPTTKLDRLPRMADFARFATAAEVPLGFTTGAFITAYTGHRDEAVKETLEADPVGAAIVDMMERRIANQEGPWEGTAKELKAVLESTVDEDTRRSLEWPKTAVGLASSLRRLVTFLREFGIRFTPPRKGAKGRRVLILEVVQISATSATCATDVSTDSNDQQDATEQLGGDRSTQVALESRAQHQPPPVSLDSNSLREQKMRSGEAEVAQEALVCSNDAAEPKRRIDLCRACGQSNWVWDGGVWVCAYCRAAAAQSERFVL